MKRKLSHLFVLFAIFYGASLAWCFCSSSFAQQNDPKIVGGELVTYPSKYPWMAALVDSSEQNIYYGQLCGGTLITPEWVVTAAHCVCDSPDNVNSPDTLDVVLGTVDLKASPDSYERLKVSRIIVNPDYNSYWTDNDVALLKLTTSSSKHPIDSLATSETDPIADNNIMATIMGWGDTEAQRSSYPNQLYEVDLPLVSNQECAAFFGEGEITDNMLCAGFLEGGKDSCFGDSGGPLVIPYSEGGYNLIGIVSWGYGCAQPNTYGVYTRVSKMREWILSQISSSTFIPPIITNNTCSSITENGATLNGTVNPNGSATTYKFEYGKTTSYGSVTPAGDAGAATTVKSVSAKLTGLTANTLYHFRLVAWNSAGTTNGGDQTFTTTSSSVPKPTVTTGSAASIAAATATLNGTVNPNGAATTYYFEYGTTTAYGKKTTTTSAGSGTTATSVNAKLTGLTAKTTYNLRLVATNSAGTTTGNNQTFTTLDNTNPGTGPTLALSSGSGAPGQPVTVNLTLTNVAGTAVSAISTDIAFDSNVLETPSAVIGTAGISAGKTITKILVGTNVFRVGVLAMDNNNAIGNGVVASVTFKIKSTATNGATTQLTQTASGSNQNAQEIVITGNTAQVSFGSTGTITKPVVTTGAASSITSSSAKLTGTVTPKGASTTYYFEYGATTSYGAKTSSLNAGSGTTAISVKANMLGLTPNTTYHFRLVATNSAGTTYGSDMVFSTALKPLVTTSSATSITSTSAILNGSVDPNGGVTDYYFEYGTTTSYGAITRDKRSKRVSTSVNESVTGLSKNTIYHFRLVATNSAGTTNGLDKTFTTLQ